MAHTCLQKTVWEIKCCLASEKAYLFPTVTVGTPTHNRTCELSETAAGTARRTPSFVAEWGMSRKLVMQEKGAHTLQGRHSVITHKPPFVKGMTVRRGL